MKIPLPCAVLLAAWAIAPVTAPVLARGDSAASTAVPESEAKAALVRLDKEFDAAPDDAARAKILNSVAKVDHPRVATALLKMVIEPRRPIVQRVAAAEGLALQGASTATVAKALDAWLASEAELDRKSFARGDIGVPLDPRTGDAKVDAPEVVAAMERGALSALVRTAALKTLRGTGITPKDPAKTVGAFLQSPFDDLVVASLEALAGWKSTAALQEMLNLYRMYPRVNRWETGAVVHMGGTNASAKKAWMVLFGHPHKQKARPAVHRALMAALETITGEKFDDPDQVAEWMKKSSSR